jgi:hypothetical protein
LHHRAAFSFSLFSSVCEASFKMSSTRIFPSVRHEKKGFSDIA